ncbi:MAG: MATE family efflux transporter, partial [bacterium]
MSEIGTENKYPELNDLKQGDSCPVEALPTGHMPQFATGSIFRPILRMGWPSIIGFLSINVYDIIDLFWVAKLGVAHVAAIALFEGFHWVLIASNDIAGFGSVAVISRRYGAGKLGHAAAAIKESFILKWLCALVSGSIGWIFMEDLMKLMGAEGEVITLGATYGRIHMLALGFYFCTYSVFTSLRSIEAPIRAMLLMVFGAVLNMILDPLLIFGWGPFPELGIAGAAWASAIAYTITLIVGLLVFFLGGAPIRLKWKGEVPVGLKTMIHMFRVGLPSGVNTVSFSLARAVITPIIAIYGTAVVAAYGVTMRVTLVGILVIFGLGLGVAPLIGNLMGAGLKDRLWKTAKQSIWLGFGITFVISLIMFLFAPLIVQVFFDDPEIIEIGVELLKIWAWGLPFIAI